MTQDLTIYSTPWCGYCRRLMRRLDRKGVPYTSVDIERDPAAARYVNGGNRTVPTVLFGEGTAVTNPRVRDVLVRLGPLAAGSSSH